MKTFLSNVQSTGMDCTEAKIDFSFLVLTQVVNLTSAAVASLNSRELVVAATHWLDKPKLRCRATELLLVVWEKNPDEVLPLVVQLSSLPAIVETVSQRRLLPLPARISGFKLLSEIANSIREVTSSGDSEARDAFRPAFSARQYVIEQTLPCLDDPKRSIRHCVANCRHQWLLVK
jgi:hypothetical protein